VLKTEKASTARERAENNARARYLSGDVQGAVAASRKFGTGVLAAEFDRASSGSVGAGLLGGESVLTPTEPSKSTAPTTSFLSFTPDERKFVGPKKEASKRITVNYLGEDTSQAVGAQLERTQPEGPGFRPVIFDFGKFEGTKKEYRGKYVIRDGKSIPLSQALSEELSGTFNPEIANVKTQEFIATQPIVSRSTSQEYGGEVTVKLQPTTSEVIERRPATLGEFTSEQIKAYKDQGYDVKVEEEGKFYVLRATARAPKGSVFDYGSMRASLLDLGFNITSEGKGLVASQVLSARRTTLRTTPKIEQMRFQSQKKLQDLIESDPAAYLRIKNFKFPMRQPKITSDLPSTTALGTRVVTPDFSKVYTPTRTPTGIQTGGLSWTSTEVLSPSFARLQTEPFTRYAYQYKKYQGKMEDYWQSQPKTLTTKEKDRLSKPLSNALGFLDEEKKTGLEGAARGIVRAPVEFGESVFVGVGALGGEAARYAYKGVIGEEDKGELAASRQVFGAQVGQVGVLAGSSLVFGAGQVALRGTQFGATLGKAASAIPAASKTIPATFFAVGGAASQAPAFFSGKISGEEYAGYIAGSALTGAAIGGFAEKYARVRGEMRARAQVERVSKAVEAAKNPYKSVSQVTERNDQLTRTMTGLKRQVKGKGFNVDTEGYSKEMFRNIGGDLTLMGQRGSIDTNIKIKTPAGDVITRATSDISTGLGVIRPRGVGYGRFGSGFSYDATAPVFDAPVTGTGVITSPGGAYAGAGSRLTPFPVGGPTGGYLPIKNYGVSGAYGRYVTGGVSVVRPVTPQGFGAAKSVRYAGVISDQPASVLGDWSWASRAALPSEGLTPFTSRVAYQAASGARGGASIQSILIDAGAPTRGTAFLRGGMTTNIAGGGLNQNQVMANALSSKVVSAQSNLVAGASSSTSKALASAQPALAQAFTTTPVLSYAAPTLSLSRATAATSKPISQPITQVRGFDAKTFLPSATARSVSAVSARVSPLSTRRLAPVQVQVGRVSTAVKASDLKATRLSGFTPRVDRATRVTERIKAPSITRTGVGAVEITRLTEKPVTRVAEKVGVIDSFRFDRPETSISGPVIPPFDPVPAPPFGGGWVPWGMGNARKRSFKPRSKRSFGYQPGFVEKVFDIRAKKQPKKKFFTELSSRPIIDSALGKKTKKKKKQKKKGWFRGGRVALW